MRNRVRNASANCIPEHSRPNEQSGYVITGKYRLRFQICDEVLQPGDGYSIPADVVHSLEVIEPGEVVDVFTPPRSDYL